MIKRPIKKMVLAALLILFLLSISFVLFRRDDYFLNKTVRLVSIRLTQFERLSRGRSQWRFEFTTESYRIFQFNSIRETWEEFAVHKYPGGILPETRRLDLEFRGGGLSSLVADGKTLGESASFILYFKAPKAGGPKKGLIFYGHGDWRVL